MLVHDTSKASISGRATDSKSHVLDEITYNIDAVLLQLPHSSAEDCKHTTLKDACAHSTGAVYNTPFPAQAVACQDPVPDCYVQTQPPSCWPANGHH